MARSRSPNNALGHLLSSSSLPVYVLDDRRQIVFCNQACADWTETAASELIGARCDYHGDPAVERIAAVAAGLCPPPEVFCGRRTRGEVTCRRGSGELSRRGAEFVLLGRDAPDHVGVIAVVDDCDLPAESPPQPARGETDPDELHRQLLTFRQQIGRCYSLDRLVGESAVMQRVRDQVRAAMASPARVVILGPPGSGREHVARTIHYADSPDTAGRLVPLPCLLADAELLQETITDVKRRPEKHEPQHPAALLLLDADQLSPAAQNELAGFFNLPGFELRTITTSTQSLLDLASQGDYRHDLALLLSTWVIELPPLSRRREDIPLLAQLLVEDANAAGGRQHSGFTEEALEYLVAYDWPGNTDQLAEFVHAALDRAAGPSITAADLPPHLHQAAAAAAHPPKSEETIVLDEFLAEIETELIQRALAQAKGNKTKAAELLGVTRARLLRRLGPEDLR